MNRTEARSRADIRRMIATEGFEHTVIVYFVKRDGSTRRMVCRYFGAAAPAHLIRVWDMEKGEARCINLDTVQEVKVLKRTDRAPMPRRSFEDTLKEIQDLF